MSRPDLRLGLFTSIFLLLMFLILSSMAVWIHILRQHELLPNESLWTNRIDTASTNHTSLANGIRIEHNLIGSISISDHKALNSLPHGYLVQSPTKPSESNFSESKRRISANSSNLIGARMPDQIATTPRTDSSPERIFFRWEQPWISWIAGAVLLSLAGAALAVSYLHRHLARLAHATHLLSSGLSMATLPESGPLELRRLNASFNEMIGKLSELQAQKNLTLAGISHDLRAPLTRLRLEIEMSSMSGFQRRLIDADLLEVNLRLEQLSQQASATKAKASAAINLTQSIDKVVKRYERLLTKRAHQIECEVDTAYFCHIDADSFSRCITNLLDNALQHGADKDGVAQIKISAQTYKQRIWLDFQDTGVGMSAEKISEMLSADSKRIAATTSNNGHGIGLSIVRQLLDQVGAKLHLISGSGNGLIARLDLPLAAPQNSELPMTPIVARSVRQP